MDASDSTETNRLPAATARIVLGDRPWKVRRFTLTEKLGRPYRLAAELIDTTEDDTNPIEAFVGSAFEFTLARGGHERAVPGFIARARVVGAYGPYKRIEIVGLPAIGLANRSRRCRIFQDQTVVEIVQDVLGPVLEHFERRLDSSRLQGTYPARDYRVQYDEDDLRFVHRVLEEEGITYIFEPDEYETMVLVDVTSTYEARVDAAGTSELRLCEHDADHVTEETLQAFSLERDLRAGSSWAGQWTWKDGPELIRAQATDSERGDPWQLLERSHHDTIAAWDRDLSEPEPDGTAAAATLALEQHLADVEIGRARTNAIGLRPGLRFELVEHPDPSLDADYLVTELVHRGDCPAAADLNAAVRDDADYVNEVRCIPATSPYRRTPVAKPRIAGMHTAIVAGHDEIDPDPHGRVRVRMRWDHDAGVRGDPERASCWLRVAMAWAGAGFGAFFVPRVGMEVIVAYLDGDPDRPVCIGCLHNGATPVPYPLPEHKTRSTIRTQTSPGGDGFNELRFEDAAGSEEVFVHAQRDLNAKVRRNASSSVGHDQTATVGHDETITVRNDRRKTVEGCEFDTTIKDHAHEVHGSQNVVVVGSQLVQINGGAGTGSVGEPPVPGAELQVIGTYTIQVTEKLVLTVANGTSIEMTPTDIVIKAPNKIRIEVPGSVVEATPGVLAGEAPDIGLTAAASGLALGVDAKLQSTTQVRAMSGPNHVTIDPSTLRAVGVNTLIEGIGIATVQSSGITQVTGANVIVAGDACVDVSSSGAITLGASGITETIGAGVINLG